MDLSFLQDLDNLGTLPTVLLIGLGLLLIFGGIGILRRVVAGAFNVAYSIAMVGAVYLSVAVLSDEIPAPETWLTFLLLTACIGLILNYRPIGAPFLETVRYALLLLTIPVLAYFILFELIVPDAETISLEIRIAISISALIAIFLLAVIARYFSRRVFTVRHDIQVDSRITREPEQTVLLADHANAPPPAVLAAMVIGQEAKIYDAPGGTPISRLAQGREVSVVGRDPGGDWLKLRHKQDLWMHRSALQIEGDPLFLRVVRPTP